MAKQTKLQALPAPVYHRTEHRGFAYQSTSAGTFGGVREMR